MENDQTEDKLREITEAANHHWARSLKQHLKETSPEYYKELVREKQLDQYLADKVITALN